MKITSVFENKGFIPSIYTCDGEDKAPILNISEVPENAEELVLIVDDPDAPMKDAWVHWILFNISPNTTKIDNENLPENIIQGMTDFKRCSWGGPCPPDGLHRYFFKLYALDKKLNLEQGSTKEEVEKAIERHILEEAELIGVYKRP